MLSVVLTRLGLPVNGKSPELGKEVMDIASLTNRWLAATGKKDKNKYYDI